jgi:bla regulator protein BlaR1
MNFMSVEMSPFWGWLLKTTVQGSVLIVLIIAIKWSLRARLTARWQYALWLLLLVRLASPWMPQSRLSLSNLIFQSVPRSHSTAMTGNHVRNNEVPNTSDPAAMSQQETGIVLAENPILSLATANAKSDTAPPQPAAPGARSDIGQAQDSSLSTVRAWLFAIWPWLWLTGVVGLGVYIGLRNLHLWLIVTGERQLVDQEVLELLEDCKQQMHVKTPATVVVTDKVRSPALFGFVRPRILLPQGLLEMVGLDELQYVFLHELAHLKRGDIYARWLTAILQILHWFNPLIWFGFRQMHADQETACDALAMSRMTSEETPLYGRTLVRLLERFSQPQ